MHQRVVLLGGFVLILCLGNWEVRAQEEAVSLDKRGLEAVRNFVDWANVRGTKLTKEELDSLMKTVDVPWIEVTDVPTFRVEGKIIKKREDLRKDFEERINSHWVRGTQPGKCEVLAAGPFHKVRQSLRSEKARELADQVFQKEDVLVLIGPGKGVSNAGVFLVRIAGEKTMVTGVLKIR